mgnify:CR=1 FL=1
MSGPTHPFLTGPRPLAMAHRGGAGEATENSPATFQRAVDLGYRWIETDVRATIDGHAIVFHDATLERTTDSTGAISTLPLSHVRNVTLHDGAHPITLVEALDRWPDVRFNIDVKDDGSVTPFLHAIAEADAWDRVCAAAFSTSRLNRMRVAAGSRLATSMGPAEVTRLVLGLPDRTPACAAQVPRAAGPLPVITRGFVRRAHRRGVQVHVWTIDAAPAMHALLDLGVDGIVTDRPSVLRDVLRDRGDWD